MQKRSGTSGVLLAISLSVFGIFLGLMTLRSRKSLKNKRISENFTLGELVRTDTGLRNVPGSAAVKNLQFVVDNFLQPLRDHFGKPIFVTSGFRSAAVNKAIGGSKNSQHLKGEAIDFVVRDEPNKKVIDAARKLGLPFDQLIDEQLYNIKGIRRDWIHVSLKRRDNRTEILTARNTRESPGDVTFTRIA